MFEKLMEAIKAANTVEAQRLIAGMNTTELNKVTNNGETALTLAAGKGLEKVCEQLILKMSNQAINKVTHCGSTALTMAASKGLEKVCEQLLLKMSEQAINQVNNYGWTALTMAASKGLEKVCEKLILKMSPQAINYVNKNGDTVLSLAQSKGYKNICDLLTNKKDNLVNKATKVVDLNTKEIENKPSISKQTIDVISKNGDIIPNLTEKINKQDLTKTDQEFTNFLQNSKLTNQHLNLSKPVFRRSINTTNKKMLKRSKKNNKL